MQKPLEGIKVLEVAQALAGPCAAMHLADYGANVIKVEPPEGELWRRYPPNPSDSKLAAAHMSRSFVRYNRNKRSIVLDLRLDKGRQIFQQLVAVADVLIENLRPGEMERLGIGYETLKALNPRLIYASISAYGHRGAESASRAFDHLAQARAGIVAARRYVDGTPVVPSVYVADLSCALMVAYAVVLSVLEREKSGLGQKIEASLLGAAVDMNSPHLVQIAGEAPSSARQDSLSCPYKCSDGRFIFISAITDQQWEALCKGLRLPHLPEDEAFRTARNRIDNASVLYPILEAVFSSQSANDWFDLLKGLGLPCALVLEREEVFHDPQVVANQFIIEQAHPLLGQVKMAGLPFRLCRTGGDIRTGAPALGEHTQDVLTELGYKESQIHELEEQGITRSLL